MTELPVIDCPPDCGHCCTIASCKESEFRAIEQYAKENGVKPIRQGLQCPWWKNGCQVYPVRPFICRIYAHGSHPMLRCVKGLNQNRDSVIKRMENEYLSGGHPTRMTHEACFSDDEIQGILSFELAQSER